ncbi:hypothetical protein LCGC14_2195880 [marine sediment metagenome]|uniref:Uncharacterized protein n=1 Tax=marine sediment metagenome TaxID=412755 RepID=A0A0F9DI67_9ZZZZ
MILVDRTRHLAGLQFCPRARYWEYEYEGVGVRGKALSIPPATGKAFHRAIEPLLKHVKATGKLPSRLAAREMIGAAVEEYQEEATPSPDFVVDLKSILTEEMSNNRKGGGAHRKRR